MHSIHYRVWISLGVHFSFLFSCPTTKKIMYTNNSYMVQLQSGDPTAVAAPAANVASAGSLGLLGYGIFEPRQDSIYVEFFGTCCFVSPITFLNFPFFLPLELRAISV